MGVKKERRIQNVEHRRRETGDQTIDYLRFTIEYFPAGKKKMKNKASAGRWPEVLSTKFETQRLGKVFYAKQSQFWGG